MKKNLKKGLAFATSAFVLVSTGGAFPARPMEVLASNEPAQSAIIFTERLAENIIPDSVNLPDNDELFAGYVEQVFGSEDGISTFSNEFAGSRLSGLDKKIYDRLKEEITEVADGKRSSAEFSIPLSELLEKEKYTEDDLGVPLLTEDNKINPEATAIMRSKLIINHGDIVDALLVDCPYELYWYDKTEGSYYSISSDIGTKYESDIGGYLYFVPTDAVSFQFTVDKTYSGSEPYTIDTSKTSQAQNAAANAQEIVKAAATLSDYQKLVYYRKKICELTSYDKAAVSNNYTYPAGKNPWQLIYVFDGVDTTNVVCEGYAKAFQYLCDETEFQDNSIYSIIVTGIMTGATGAGPHMWNVVHMGNGNNYLVDVTNCDDGSTGADDKLFLTGYTTGSVDEGYTIKIPSEIPEMERTVTYQYDKDEYADIAAIYGKENITLVQGGILKESDLSTEEVCEHNYEAVFNWADDNKSCTVTLSCQKDKTHVVPGLACNVTSTVKTPATCAAKGITSYTAKVTYAGNTYEVSKEIEDIEKDPFNHTGNTEVRNQKEATSTAAGYTGDTYCKDCDKKISSGTTIPATGSGSTGGSSTSGGGSSSGGSSTSDGSSSSGGNSRPGGSEQPSEKPVIDTKEDGSFTETTVTETKNEQNNDVTVTTVVSKDAGGKVTGSEIKSVIHTEGAEITVAVKKDSNGKTESADAKTSVTGRVGSANKTTATLSADTASQVIKAAGTDNVDVEYTIWNEEGKKAYTVTVNAADLTQGNKLFVVYVSSSGETILVNAKEYTVKNNGSVSISMSEKHAYQLITEEKMDQVSKQILKTVTSAKKQVSIEKNATTSMNLSSKANKKNIKSVKYSSSKSSVAKVDKNGKVKGVKKGTATIKAKVTLKNGAVKTVKMKVTVK